MNPNKKYGLILSKKSKDSSHLKPRLSVFNNDDSSDEDGKSQVNSQIHKEAMKKIVKKQTKLEIQKALEEDATVYEYDQIYDDMKSKSIKENTPSAITKADKHKQPKYIGSLLKAAEARNRERQRVEERKIEKEREQEGDTFKDKPAFVTSAYRKRMQEKQEEEEQERREAAIEDALDVRKQKDLSGFYRHFLRQQMGEEPSPTQGSKKSSPTSQETTDNEKDASNMAADVTNEDDRDTDMSFSSSSDEDDHKQDSNSSRKRAHSSDSSENPVNPQDDTNDATEKLCESKVSTSQEGHRVNKQTKQNPENTSSSFVKRTDKDSVLSARERYLARKKLGQSKRLEGN
uniref:Nuclear speckle splicing regulatory protein 1 n=1 Tax=Phallusia mammillata TaxID=59560 RepID=A0A6F9DLX6_9ASCI|nr:nuclear speckle splicing regulatory protein 1 [Phallusia mammillata]